MRSASVRFIVVGILTLLMSYPLMMAGDIVQSRAEYSRATLHSVGQEWGGSQTLRGPVLGIPVTKREMVRRQVEITDPETGVVQFDPETKQVLYRYVEEEQVSAAAPVFVLPKVFTSTLDTQTQQRARGIFQVPVYTAQVSSQFTFDLSKVEAQLGKGETAIWTAADLRLDLSSNRALRGDAELLADGRAVDLEPGVWAQGQGLVAALGDPRTIGSFDLSLLMNGANQLGIAPVGRNSTVTFTSDWPHPSFYGAFLPDSHDVRDDGFSASWKIPHLARTVPEIGRHDPLAGLSEFAFGARLIEPNDFYQMAYRAARYGLLYVALTFLTVLLIQGSSERPVHPVQYIMIGLLQSMFVVLMVAYAEQIGFALAYLLAASAMILTLTLYAFVVLKLGRWSLVLGATLVALYGVIFLILRSVDFALLAGSTLMFFALVATMFATRKQDWYGGPSVGLRARWLRKGKNTTSQGAG